MTTFEREKTTQFYHLYYFHFIGIFVEQLSYTVLKYKTTAWTELQEKYVEYISLYNTHTVLSLA